MASISSVGIGSGILTSDLIDKLVAAEKTPATKRLDAKQTDLETKLSSYGRVQSALTSLRLPARVLSLQSAMSNLSATSTKSGVSVATSSSAKAGQYSVSVSQLAQSHAIASAGFAASDSALGTGTINVTVGGVSKAITIDSSNNTLQGISDAINAESELALNADVVFNGSTYQLVLSSEETGLDNAISVSITGDADGSNTDNLTGLSRLSYNGTANNMSQTVEARDAIFKVNGVTIQRDSNKISDAVAGLTFTLTDEIADASPAVIKVAPDADGVAEKIQEFVDAYNEYKTVYNELTEFDSSSLEAGVLLGDATLRSVDQQMRGVLGSIVSGLESAGIRSLAEVGIKTNKDTGELEFDEDVFKSVYADNVDDITALFATQGRTSDSQVKFLSSTSATKAGSFDINITQMSTKGSYTGSASIADPNSIVIDTNNNTFSLSVDGTTSGTITLSDNGGVGYTATALAAEMTSQINADSVLRGKGLTVAVTYDSGAGTFVLTSNSYGSTSAVNVVAVGSSTAATLGLSVGSGTAGVDVAGTIDGVAGTGKGQMLTAADSSDAKGISVSITGGSTGDRGTVTFIHGIGRLMVDKITSLVGAEGSLTTKQDGLRGSLEDIDTERDALDRKVEALQLRLAKQFSAADILISNLNSTMDYISAQLSALAGTSSSDK